MPSQTDADLLNQARQTAEEEAERDWHKPLKQLLVDVHHEINLPGRTMEENAAHANKRIASVLVRTAGINEEASKSNEKASKLLIRLTTALFIFTAVLVCCGLVQVVLSIIMIMQQANLFPGQP
jgi:hypothetical protein